MKILQYICGYLLDRIPRGSKMNTYFHNALARHTVTIAIETILLSKDKKSVFLTKRKSGIAYENLWHFPGSILRTKENISDVFQRLSKDEYGVPIIKWRTIHQKYGEEKRGTFLFIINIIETEYNPSENIYAKWWQIDQLPENMITFQKNDYISILKKLNVLP